MFDLQGKFIKSYIVPHLYSTKTFQPKNKLGKCRDVDISFDIQGKKTDNIIGIFQEHILFPGHKICAQGETNKHLRSICYHLLPAIIHNVPLLLLNTSISLSLCSNS